ncbi:DUF4312 family protein [Abyssisolibacter fermentans]|uniref:DUF4312 family protein n=1 Tax=Abyssisolibacter fermentans TaxID=1766203 RepID=UPI00082D78CB|nr:DUF4312 family protein [Abyssisolibacter fermentans]
MSDKQYLQSKEVELIIEGSGKTKKDVFAAIFTKLRKQIYSEVQGLILHMEPTKVYILSEEVNKINEAFLWFFMKREKTQYKIKAKVIVAIKYLDLAEEE